jgi:hypothetical protein
MCTYYIHCGLLCMVLNEEALAFEETDCGTLREDYFSPYIMPTIPHTAWKEKNIPIPPGICDKGN